jgi:hypothetical protein
MHIRANTVTQNMLPCPAAAIVFRVFQRKHTSVQKFISRIVHCDINTIPKKWRSFKQIFSYNMKIDSHDSRNEKENEFAFRAT